MSSGDSFGYLLVHSVEDPDRDGEQVHFSLSDGDDPCYLTAGRWEPIPPDQFRMPPNTKHGGVLPLRGDEWRRVRETYAGSPLEGKAPAK